MNEMDKMFTGELYDPNENAIMAEQQQCLEKQYEYNLTRPSEGEKRERLLKEMFAEIGRGCYIEPPLHANWGGHHVHFGDYVYANFNLTLVDDTHIYVGDHTMIGPNVTLATAGHPVWPELREKVRYSHRQELLAGCRGDRAARRYHRRSYRGGRGQRGYQGSAG